MLLALPRNTPIPKETICSFTLRKISRCLRCVCVSVMKCAQYLSSKIVVGQSWPALPVLCLWGRSPENASRHRSSPACFPSPLSENWNRQARPARIYQSVLLVSRDNTTNGCLTIFQALQ